MFDVFWTDPDRELVGEHRAKKKLAREKKQAEEKSGGARKRHSRSARVSAASTERALGIFSSRSLRKVVVPSKTKHASSSPNSPNSLNTSNSPTVLVQPPQHRNLLLSRETPKRDSGASDSLSDILRGNEKSTLQSPAPLPEHRIQKREHISYPSSRDSAISKWTERTALTNLSPSAASFVESAKSSAVQQVGPPSLTAKSTEVALRPRTPDADVPNFISEISPLSGDDKRQPQTPEAGAVCSEEDIPINLFPGPKSPLRSFSKQWASGFKPNSVDAWKPAAVFNSTVTAAGTSVDEAKSSTADSQKRIAYPSVDATESSPEDTQAREARRSRALERHRMKTELELMAAADKATILKRLCESWDEVTDVDLYKDLEMEKKRWMISALFNMDKVDKGEPSSALPPKKDGEEPRKVLAFHEYHAATSYLATLHSEEQIYHISSSPLSNSLFSNINPVTAPATSKSFLPFESEMFSAAYSLSLPSVAIHNEISDILKEVHRCLKTGATFRITLIDPYPLLSNMGPHLQGWFNKHLTDNLQNHIRCSRGSMLFPQWLAESCLRGPGSMISAAKFRAITTEESLPYLTKELPNDDKVTKLDLRTTMGRLLWKEVWGPYVEGNKWWWEDPDIVRECVEIQTYWDYYVIDAVKHN